MASVQTIVSTIPQPQGGFLNIDTFEQDYIEDFQRLSIRENLHPAVVGLIVDYMTRFMLGKTPEEAFSISLKGAKLVNELDFAKKLCRNIKGLDDRSLQCAEVLVSYDVYYRKENVSPGREKQEPTIDDTTCENIRIMVNRCLTFFNTYGLPLDIKHDFEGAYTDVITQGESDYLTQDTLWDLKVSKYKPGYRYTLQLLFYYVLGLHSKYKDYYESLKCIGLYNPRLNTLYRIETSKITEKQIKTVEKMIGYKQGR